MKMSLLALALLATPALAGDRDRGPGTPGTPAAGGYDYAVTGFDAIGLGGAAQVDVHVGGGFSVRAEGPAAAFANFRIARDGNRLTIGRRFEGRDNPLERDIRVHVTLPRLVETGIGGSGRMTIDAVRGAIFAAGVGGSGTIAVADLTVDKARLSVGGSGSVSAAGRTRALIAEIGGSGRIDAAGLHATSATVSVGGSGHVRASVDGPAQVSTAGGGDVDLGPAAQCTISRVGGGAVRCGG